MSYEFITIKRLGAVAMVTFDRKENLNAFNQKLMKELTQVALSFHEDIKTQAVVVTGSPQAFSAGVDLKERQTRFTGKASDLELRQVYYRGVRMCEAWERMPQITVAAIEKMAVGGGVAFSLACDWRVMGEKAFLYVPEVKIGINLQWGALPRLVSLVGPARAKRICILCERMQSPLALNWGLVDGVAKDGCVVDEALRLAKSASAMPKLATRMVKEAVNATANALHGAASYADADQSQVASNSSEAQAMANAFNRDKSS